MFETVRKDGWTSVTLRPVKWEQPLLMPLPSARLWPSLGAAVGVEIMEIPWSKTNGKFWHMQMISDDFADGDGDDGAGDDCD